MRCVRVVALTIDVMLRTCLRTTWIFDNVAGKVLGGTNAYKHYGVIQYKWAYWTYLCWRLSPESVL